MRALEFFLGTIKRKFLPWYFIAELPFLVFLYYFHVIVEQNTINAPSQAIQIGLKEKLAFNIFGHG